MSTLPKTEYKVTRVDADSTSDDLSKTLTDAARDGWKLVNTYHLHHLNSIDFILSRDLGSLSE